MCCRFLLIMLCCASQVLYAQQGIRSVVIEKKISNTNRAWNVYSDAKMENVIGFVKPGDSVSVISWRQWTYMIETNSIAGYISWRALLVTPALREMAKELETRSDSLERIAVVYDSLEKYKNLHYWLPVMNANSPSESLKNIHNVKLPSDQSAFLRLYTSDSDIDAGECTVVNFSFYVADFNRLALQFHDLANQLSNIIAGPLNQPGSWNGNGKISEVKGTSVKINDTGFTEYRLFSNAYCPVEAKSIEFKEVQLTLMKIDHKEKRETPILFTSKPLRINVRPANNVTATTSDFFKLTGKFVVTDSVYTRIPGSPVVYTLSLKGKGFSFPVEAPILTDKGFASELISIKDADTILHDTYYSSKTFTWNLYMKAGEYQLWDKPVFSAYDPGKKSVTEIVLNRPIRVSIGQDIDAKVNNRPAPDHFILVDVSQSMMIEDYLPNRLGMVKKGLHNFLTKRSLCNVGLITFSGRALRYDIFKKDICYSGELISKIGFSTLHRGTAMGDAVWLAIHSINPAATVKKIVMIGDGENTAGYTNFSLAIALASKYKVVVYTIGIGKSNLVPFGHDLDGKPLLIPSNFSDVMLRQIAEQTGGKYFHAESLEDVARLLKEIVTE